LVTSRSFVVGLLKKNFFRHGYRKYEFPHSQGQNHYLAPADQVELMHLDQLKPNVIVRGAIFPEPVQVIVVVPTSLKLSITG